MAGWKKWKQFTAFLLMVSGVDWQRLVSSFFLVSVSLYSLLLWCPFPSFFFCDNFFWQKFINKSFVSPSMQVSRLFWCERRNLGTFSLCIFLLCIILLLQHIRLDWKRNCFISSGMSCVCGLVWFGSVEKKRPTGKCR